MERINIIGVKVSATNIEEVTELLQNNFKTACGNYICVSNVHTTVYAHEHPDYRDIQNNSFLSLPDGKPLSVIGKKRGLKKMERITGPEFLEEILRLSETTKWSHYFYGNTKENLDTLIQYLKRTYPFLNIAGYEPSLFRNLSMEEEKELVDRINLSKADFVWIGLGAPRQEIFCQKFSDKTESLWVGVGGAFNVLPGIIPRAPEWMQKYCLEWLYRLLKEPRRLFKRYFITNSKFILYLIKDGVIKK